MMELVLQADYCHYPILLRLLANLHFTLNFAPIKRQMADNKYE
jgi:hypothetical protein